MSAIRPSLTTAWTLRSGALRPAPRARDAQRPARLGPWAGACGAGASAGLLVLAFPPADAGALAFIALVPLLLACRGRGMRTAAGLGFVFGAASGLGIFHWLWVVPGIGVVQMAVLATYVALYPAAWCALLPALQRCRMPLALTAPAAWVALEMLRSHAGFLALPWAALAHSQHDNLALLQVAALTGEAGVSFAVVAINVAVAQWLAARSAQPLAAAAMLVGALHAGGALVLALAPRAPTITLAAIQPVIPLDARASPDRRAAAWQRLEALTLEAARARPAVIVWPETAVPDPLLSDELAQRLGDLARRAGAPIVVGAAQVEKFAARAPDGGLALRARATHNAAYLVAPRASELPEPYRKRRLVPFAEYMPLEGAFEWPAWLVPQGLARLQAGAAPPRWMLPDGTRVAALICWENLFAGLARDAVRDGARVLVQLTDDAWFGRTAAARQHNLASVLRAVENRVPVVIASNTGPSQIVDAYGRIAGAAHADFTPGIAVARVPYASVPDPAGASLHRFIHAAARLPLSVVPPLRRTRLDERSA